MYVWAGTRTKILLCVALSTIIMCCYGSIVVIRRNESIPVT